MPLFELIPTVTSVIANIENGNITTAVKFLEKLPKKPLMAVVAYVVERAPDHVREIFLRALERNLY